MEQVLSRVSVVEGLALTLSYLRVSPSGGKMDTSAHQLMIAAQCKGF